MFRQVMIVVTTNYYWSYTNYNSYDHVG